MTIIAEAEPAPTAQVSPAAVSRSFTPAAILIVVGIFSTSLAQDALLGRLPLQNLLKNELHESRSAVSAFFFFTGFAWYFKPLAGVLTDAFPVFGSRRKAYLLAGAILGCLAWMLIWITPHRYQPLLWVVTLNSSFIMIASTAIGAILVETAHAASGSGRLTSLRYIVQFSCAIIGTLGGGYLATVDIRWTAVACAAALFAIVPVTLIFLHEQPVYPRPREILADAGRRLKNIGTAGSLWAAGGLIACFFVAPGFATAVFYIQQNSLHMSTQSQGFLNMLAAVAAILGALTYSFTCRWLRLRTSLLAGLSFSTATTLGFLFYSSVLNAQIVEVIHAFAGSLAVMALVDLATRATPIGSEGLGYALIISITNLVRFGTDWLGSFMLDTLHVSFSVLVLANAATTLIAVPLVLLMPLALVNRREIEPAPDEPVAGALG